MDRINGNPIRLLCKDEFYSADYPDSNRIVIYDEDNDGDDRYLLSIFSSNTSIINGYQVKFIFSEWFITLAEYREQQINAILE